MGITIDHVVVNVADRLDEAQRRWEALGFHITPRGHHTLGSSNNLAIFGQDYLELLGIEPGRAATRMDLMDLPPGLTGLALKPGGPGFAEALAADGVAIGPAREFSRPVELEDGSTPDARFRTAQLTDGRVGHGRLFLCHHYTPGLVWRPAWQGHPNGALGLSEFVFRSADPAGLAALLGQLGGDPVAVPGGFAVPAGPATISVLSPDAVGSRFGDAVPAGATDRMVALGVRVADLARAAALAGVEVRARMATVPHAAASGLALRYVT